MNYQVLVSVEAQSDTYYAAIYYEEVQIGLGARFLDELEQKYKALSENPFYYGYVDSRKVIRDVSLPHFPYSVIFVVDEKKVIVLAIHNHFKNNEPYW